MMKKNIRVHPHNSQTNGDTEGNHCPAPGALLDTILTIEKMHGMINTKEHKNE
jgi:hypothetical protein